MPHISTLCAERIGGYRQERKSTRSVSGSACAPPTDKKQNWRMVQYDPVPPHLNSEQSYRQTCFGDLLKRNRRASFQVTFDAVRRVLV